jgi:predicted phosphohydrolase
MIRGSQRAVELARNAPDRIAVVARIFALADLHLSSSGAKPMDVFGSAWERHMPRMAETWDRTVAPDDVVLLAGDLSWARDLEEAREDLAWIGARPGRKVLLRGNHDSWWQSGAKVRRALGPGCELLQNGAVDLGDAVLVGARGWTAPDDPFATAEDRAVFRRELDRLRLSIADADRRLGRERARVAMAHFPPWIVGRPRTPVVDLLTEAGVRTCVYGHLHGADHALGVAGRRDGIEFRLVAADAVDFTPVRIPL